jgi:hypothetical protein
MDKKTNQKQKLIVTILIVIIAFFLTYKLTFEKTYHLILQYNANNELIKSIESAPKRISYLQKEIQILDKLIENEASNSSDPKSKIIEFTEQNCKKLNLSLVELSEPFIQNQVEYNIYYNKLIIDGDYFNILRFINEIEDKNLGPNIISIRILSEKKKYSEEYRLFAEIFFQTIINNSIKNETI